jgi:hypothetical protein
MEGKGVISEAVVEGMKREEGEGAGEEEEVKGEAGEAIPDGKREQKTNRNAFTHSRRIFGIAAEILPRPPFPFALGPPLHPGLFILLHPTAPPGSPRLSHDSISLPPTLGLPPL